MSDIAGGIASDVGPVEAEIRRRIAAAGPMPVAEYMQLALTLPQHGYYVTRDPLGTDGDFITAPEISQMFGELIGLWMAATWKQQMGAPGNVRIVELGPGRGTMMLDALRAAQVMPGFREAVTLHFVEVSPALQQQQEQAFLGSKLPASWHASLDDVPREGPAIILANEFFDALPVHQAVRQADGWYERLIDIDADGIFVFTLAREPLRNFDTILPPQVRAAPEGVVFEWRTDTTAMEIGRRIAHTGGAALIIDYGHAQSGFGETLQAVGGHAFADTLTAPGTCDLTAHVDFQALGDAASAMGCKVFGPIVQSELLGRLGIRTRAAALKAGRPSKAAEVDAALARLIGHGRTGMGELFKAIALADPKLGVPPGFD
ncbi:MAG TPA: SAM-dependent methyltransferase [Pseudolabrys sp.]|nr:SAM-dependent methyltransferase [Pseudolabrys sp.]